MDRCLALELLLSASAFDRLRAARVLRNLALPADDGLIRDALASETDAWVRGALLRIAEPSAPVFGESNRATEIVEDLAQLAHDVRLLTTQELTAMVTHELEPLVGTLRGACMNEISRYEESSTKRAIDSMESFLAALVSLHRASIAPSINDFNLSDTVYDVIRALQVERLEQRLRPILVAVGRNDPVSASGDPDLVRLALVNVLRNAMEASDLAAGGDEGAVIVSWGTTDRDSWVAVLDRGVGLPSGASRMRDPGVTTKDKSMHTGMGLAVTVMALESMGGNVSHYPREGGGVVAEIRWAESGASDARTSS